MEDYQIIVTPDAESDLTELRTYIAEVLLAPETARDYIRTLREEIGKLSCLAGVVYILNVIYAKRDQLRALKQMNTGE